MNLFELFVKIGAKDEASGTISKITSGLGKGLATAAKIGTAAVGAAAAGITALTKQSVQSYAEFEQLVGGAELMFGDAFQTVMQNAQDAYKTVQMSQNEYLQQVNGFATGLKTALGGNEQAAAELAHNIVQAEADIIAATGNTAENVQNAFNGIMKSNFTMLDNLQIGITPTKEGFQEVIDKVNEWNKANGEATSYQMGNLADMQSALVDYIEMVGMSGYAQAEASKTISGSIASMKSAWSNLLTGLADDNADFGKLVDNLVYTLAGDESGEGGVINNMLPRIEKAIGGIATLIEKAAPILVDALPPLVNRVVPSLISAATGMVNAVIKVLPDLLNTVVDALIQNAPALITAAIGFVQSLIQGIQDNYQILVDGAIQIVTQLATGVLNMLPKIVALGLDLIVSLANGIATSLPTLIPTIIDVVLKIVETLTNQETLTQLLGAAFTIITELAWGLIDNIDKLLDAVFLLIDGMIDFLLRPANLAMLIETAIELVLAIGTGIIKAIPQLLVSVATLIGSIFANFFTADWKSIGTNLVDGLKKGISNAWTNLKKWFKNLFGDLIGIAKKILGIKSPSRVFRDQIGKQMAAGLGLGWEDEFGKVKSDIEDSLDFDDASVGINASIRKVGSGAAGGAFGGTSIGNININIDGAKYNDEQSLASAIALEIQNMTDRRAAVYA